LRNKLAFAPTTGALRVLVGSASEASIVDIGPASCLIESGLLVAFLYKEQATEGDSVERRDFADDQRKAMLKAIHEREGGWDRVDPDTGIASIGEGIGLSEDRSYELFGRLVDEHYVDPGRILQAGGAMPGHTSRIVGREDNMTVIGDDVRLTGKGRAEIG
jgi:hypothetical protein